MQNKINLIRAEVASNRVLTKLTEKPKLTKKVKAPYSTQSNNPVMPSGSKPNESNSRQPTGNPYLVVSHKVLTDLTEPISERGNEIHRCSTKPGFFKTDMPFEMFTKNPSVLDPNSQDQSYAEIQDSLLNCGRPMIVVRPMTGAVNPKKKINLLANHNINPPSDRSNAETCTRVGLSSGKIMQRGNRVRSSSKATRPNLVSYFTNPRVKSSTLSQQRQNRFVKGGSGDE